MPRKSSSSSAVAKYKGYGAYRSTTKRPRANPRTMYGHGDYSEKAPESLGKRLGRLAIGAGKLLPPPFGQIAGLIGQATGLGAYKIRYNSIIKDVNPSQIEDPAYIPVIANRGSNRTVRMRHREYIGEVLSSVNFVNTSYQINPANENLFPWLSEIAQMFQEYRFHGLVFEFISLSSNALTSTNTALGAVILATNYNAGDANFASKQAAENSEFALSAKPSESIMAGIECDPQITVNGGHLYVSPNYNGTAPSGQDIKTYNMGNFQVMTQGMQAANVDIGELWVSYDIEFMKPIIPASWAAGRADHYVLNNVTDATGGLLGATQTTKTSLFGTTLTTSTSTITLPENIEPGMVIKIDYLLYGGSGSSGATSVQTIYSSNLTYFTPPLSTSGGYYNTNGSSATQFVNTSFVTVNNTYTPTSPATIQFGTSGTNLPGGTVNGDLIITVMPANYV